MAPAADNSIPPAATTNRERRRVAVRAGRPHPFVPPLPPPVPSESEPAPGEETAARGRQRRRRRRGQEETPEAPGPALAVAPAPEASAAEAPEEKPKRRRRRRKRHAEAAQAEAVAPEAPAQAEPPPEEPATEAPEEKPKRRRRRRKRHAEAAQAEAAVPEAPAQAEPPPEEPTAEAPEEKPKRRRRRRSRQKAEEPVRPPEPPAERPQPRTTILVGRKSRAPVTGPPTMEVPAPFAHPAEYEFARILDFYGIEWQYEPRSFPLRWEHGHVTEAFTPDFYLPDLNLYVELTTLKSGLTAEKNRKVRLLKELYPEVNIKLLKKRDYLRLLAKYGYEPLAPEDVPEIARVLIATKRLQQRVAELGERISRDYAGKEPVLIGVLRGVFCFMADLVRHISVPTTIDFMAISSYEGNGAGAVRILKDIEENIKGRDVILVEDIVDTGMTLNHILEYLSTKKPASLKVCALLDKRARRIANVPLEYVGFEIPDEFVVGYGLDFRQRFRNLPFIAVLKHEMLP